MIPLVADQTRPVPGIAGKRPASDLDKLQHDCACKRAAHRGHQSIGTGKGKGMEADAQDHGKGKEADVQDHGNGKGKEADVQDHGKEANASGSKKLKRYKGIAIDINRVPHHDDSDLESPPDAGGKRSAPHRALSSETKKKELEIDAKRLKLEQQRAKWAIANLRKDMELEKMRLENERMKLANKQLRVKIKRRALELGIDSEMIPDV